MTRDLPTGVFARGGKLWIKVRQPDGSWRNVATGLVLDQGAAAGQLRDQVQARIDAGDVASAGPQTVASYAKQWMTIREGRGLSSIRDDRGRMNNHVVPGIGRMKITEVRPRHIRSWVQRMRANPELAPATIRNVYALARTMFQDAVIDEVIIATPCVLRRGDLPPKMDADPEWRASAIFTRAEVEQLISDERIPWDRRAIYALLFLTGGRAGEVEALRWRHYDNELAPLGRMLVAGSYSIHLKREKRTKTNAVRKVPVHPVLASILASWKLEGWAKFFGRMPTADDLIVPSRQRKFMPRNTNAVRDSLHRDLVKIGLRKRRTHDARRTFRSLLEDDGGQKATIEWIIWGRGQKNERMYDEPSWERLCEPVQQLRIVLRGGELGTVGTVFERKTRPGTEQRRGGRRVSTRKAVR